MVLHGVVAAGQGRAAAFTQIPWARDQFEEKLGMRVWPGTFNVRLVEVSARRAWQRLLRDGGIDIQPPDSTSCVAHCYRVLVNEQVQGAVIVPHVPGYPPDQVEVLAAENLRARLGLADGDPVTLSVVEAPTHPPGAEEGDRGGTVSAERGGDLRARALSYVARHNTVSLATSGPEGLWAATVFYANVGFDIYYLSEPKTRHVQNLLANPSMAATINEDYRDWREIKGVQLEGECHEVTGNRELARALSAYLKKYPFVAQFLSPGQLLKGMQIAGRALDVRLYRVRPTRALFIDNERGFSNREEVPLT